MKNLTCYLILLGCLAGARAQNSFGIVPQQADQPEVCTHFDLVFENQPREIQFRVFADSRYKLYFEVTDMDWFRLLFSENRYGVSVDLVSKKQYDCDSQGPGSSFPKGVITRPIYGKDLVKGLESAEDGLFRTQIGTIPEGLRREPLEYNLVFLTENTLCRYQTFFELEAYSWDLLNMGMYLDSLTYPTQLSGLENGDKYTLKYKTLTFSVPFEKNKSTYAAEDLKPLYDSLRLTDYNIRKIQIRSYASIEGNTQRNLELQTQRAQSMVGALQSFQQPSIETEVSSSENWVEFLEDIRGTKYESLRQLSKAEIKTALETNLAGSLEPILSNHRKAVITLELEKKDRYQDQNIDQLIGLFNEAIGSDALETAEEVQLSIFERLKDGTASPDDLDRMELPRQRKYVSFFNKNSAFRYLMDERNMLIAYNEIQSLVSLDPTNPKLRYNLTALKLQLWRYAVQSIADEEILQDIQELRSLGIAEHLIQRMLVNYHIVRSEYLMRQRQYEAKDASVRYIVTNYSKIPLRDYDYLSLAQYLAYYANLEEAVYLVSPAVRRLEVSDNLVFYYLNLTLTNRQLTGAPDYRTILFNAIGKDPARFCRLFNPIPQGGMTFQMLDNNFLKDVYCENCTTGK